MSLFVFVLYAEWQLIHACVYSSSSIEQDLFSLEEGVPTTLSAEEDATISLINFDKLRLLYQLLKEFRQLQQTPYTTLDG